MAREIRRAAFGDCWSSQCLCKRAPSALAMTVEQVGPCPNHKGDAAGIDIDRVAVERSQVVERLDRDQVVPSRDERIVLATLYFVVLLVDLLENHRVHPHGDDPEDEQSALHGARAPALGKWST